MPYKKCLDSSHPAKSVMAFCKKEFIEEEELGRCTHGFCDLCCVLVQSSDHLLLEDKVVTACHQDCQNKYGYNAPGDLVEESGAKVQISAESLPKVIAMISK